MRNFIFSTPWQDMSPTFELDFNWRVSIFKRCTEFNWQFYSFAFYTKNFVAYKKKEIFNST